MNHKKNVGIRIVHAGLLLLTAAALTWPRSAAPAAGAPSIPLAANSRTLPAAAHILGVLGPDHPLHLIVGLRLQHHAELTAFLRDRARPGSPVYGTALTSSQFADRYSPSLAEQALVVDYLQSNGLKVVRTYPDRLLLDVSGTAAQASAAFGTTIVRYRDRTGHEHFANAAQPRLPQALAALVSSIIGLRDDEHAVHAPALNRRAPRAAHPPKDAVGRPQGARTAGQPRTIPAPPVGLLTPAQIQTQYNFAPIYFQGYSPGAGIPAGALTGAGQTIALFELSPFDQADLDSFNTAFNLPAIRPTLVNLDGGPTNSFGASGRLEATADVEWAHAMAPGATIIVYSGRGLPTGTDNSGADHVYAALINAKPAAHVLSTSWGQCEPDQLADTPSDTDLMANLFQQATAEGMTIVAASGDAGANDCTSGRTNPSVDYPASDANVLAVGGTAIGVDGSGQITSEVGWPQSGGGISQLTSNPRWQTAQGIPANATKRYVPDVAINAVGYAVWVSGGWQQFNGTSAGPPLWSALLALVNQARYAAISAASGGSLPAACATPVGMGNVNSDLYQLAANPTGTPPLRDITTGSSNGAGAPGPGWDPVTGLGVPNAAAMVPALVARPDLAVPSCPIPSPTPTASATATSTATPTMVPTATATPTSTQQTQSSTVSFAALPSLPVLVPFATVVALPSATATPTPLATASGVARATRTRVPSGKATATASTGGGAAPTAIKVRKSTGTGTHATHAKTVHPKKVYVAPVIPPLTGSVALKPSAHSVNVAAGFRFAAHVQLHVTVIQRGQPRRHLLIPTDAHAVAVYRFVEVRPKPNHVLTVTIRAWGVYVHHRRSIVLTFKLRG